jgi:hypothetical protein
MIRTYDALYVFGYRVGDFSFDVLPVPELTKKNTCFSYNRVDVSRRVVGRSLGWHVEGFAPLIPDYKDLDTQRYGAIKRFAKSVPQIDSSLLREFRSFVRSWLNRNLVPIPHDEDLSFDTWIELTNYPRWRKDQLCLARVDVLSPRDFNCRSFIKRESYFIPKHARWINSRTDAFKAYSGPYFAAIEKRLFNLDCFIKHVCVSDRSKFVYDKLFEVGAKYLETDHTAFEAHFVPKFVMACEMQLYSYMLAFVPNSYEVIGNIKEALTMVQKCSTSMMVTKTCARMSGDMCTSLGNGFSNLMLMSFAAHKYGWSELCGVVEGDDGLFKIDGEIPDSSFFERLGFEIKMEIHDSINEAGFCSLYFSDDSFDNIINPLECLLRSGWTMSCQLHGGHGLMDVLSRTKAMSILCESPTTPIVCKMALWILRSTSHISRIEIDNDPNRWWLNQLDFSNLDLSIAKAKIGPTMGQRLFVELKYGISVGVQFEIEHYFDKLVGIQPIRCPNLISLLVNEYPWWAWSWDFLTHTAYRGDRWR